MGFDKIGPECNGTAKLHRRILEFMQVLQHRSEIVVRFGQIRVEADGGFERIQRRFEIS